MIPVILHFLDAILVLIWFLLPIKVGRDVGKMLANEFQHRYYRFLTWFLLLLVQGIAAASCTFLRGNRESFHMVMASLGFIVGCIVYFLIRLYIEFRKECQNNMTVNQRTSCVKQLRICYEIQNYDVDKNGDSCPGYVQIKYVIVDDIDVSYFNALSHLSGPECFDAMGLADLVSGHPKQDFRRISPEEFDEKTGKKCSYDHADKAR